MSISRSQASIAAVRREAMERLVRLRLQAPAPVLGLRNRISEVVILASSSRGGSSVVAEILRRSDHMLHFRAEVNPFFLLSGHAWPESLTGSDALGAEHLGDAAVLEHLLACDAGRRTDTLDDPHAFALELHWRLSLQWPLERFDAERVEAWMQATFSELHRDHGWPPGAFVEPQVFHVLFLARVRAVHAGVNPWYYDIRPDLIERHCPDAVPCDAPPSAVVLEEPPFVTVTPWRPVTPQDLRRPLVIKTPSNVYRLPFLRALFPNARLRVLHLTRNAAAAINGLYDGWRFRGFFAHHLPGQLQMDSYTDHYPAWGADWWKYDLPPGWREWAHRPLVQVCGFQWRSAHETILAYLRAHPQTDHRRFAFEELVGPMQMRQAAFSRLCRWLGVPLDAGLAQLVEDGLPPIMATSRPRWRRWYDKAELLEPVLQLPQTRAILEQLDYGTDPTDWT